MSWYRGWSLMPVDSLSLLLSVEGDMIWSLGLLASIFNLSDLLCWNLDYYIRFKDVFQTRN